MDDLTPIHYAQVAEEVVGTGVAAQFTYGLMRISQNRAGVVGYYGYDAGGSVRELLSTAGMVTDTYSYDAFGNTVAQTGSTPNEFLYRGEQFDAALGIYYLRARYYVPRTGRFLIEDKYEGDDVALCCKSQQLIKEAFHHLYAYTNGDPINYIDSSGLGIIDRIVLVVDAFYQLQVTASRVRCLAGLILLATKLADGTLNQSDYRTYLGLLLTGSGCRDAFFR